MARYTVSNGTYPGAEGYAFAGFDELGGECVEATNASALGRPMQPAVRRELEKLEPGQRSRNAAWTYFFREW